MIQQVHQELKKTLQGIQKKKKFAFFAQKIIWGFTGIFFLFILLNNFFALIPSLSLKVLSFESEYLSNPYVPIIAIVALMVIVQVSVLVYSNVSKKYTEDEQSAIARMAKALFPTFTYHITSYLVSREVVKSRIFAWLDEEDLKSQVTYGYMKGKVENVSLHISDIGITEANVSRKIKSGIYSIPFFAIWIAFYEFILKNIFTKKSADNVYHTFRGLFCWADFNKHIDGYTVVLTDKLESTLGSLAQSIQNMNFKRDQLVTLEDPLFEKEFVVYSTDQVEARYILSTSLMEKIYELKQKFNRPLMMAFFENKVYMTVSIPHGVFSINPDLLDSFKAIEEIYNYVSSVQLVVTDLSLNKKIWKQPVDRSLMRN